MIEHRGRPKETEAVEIKEKWTRTYSMNTLQNQN